MSHTFSPPPAWASHGQPKGCMDANGNAVASVHTYDGEQGQSEACPRGSEWNYSGPSGWANNRSTAQAHGAHYMEGAATMASMDPQNLSRFRPHTQVHATPQALSNGQLGGLGYWGGSVTPSMAMTPMNAFVGTSLQLKEQAARRAGHEALTNRRACAPGFASCAAAGNPYTGYHGDGCVSQAQLLAKGGCGGVPTVGRSYPTTATDVGVAMMATAMAQPVPNANAMAVAPQQRTATAAFMASQTPHSSQAWLSGSGGGSTSVASLV